MRIDFNILWVENQPEYVQAQRTAIDRKMRDEGFRLQVEFPRSVDEAKAYLSSDIYGDHIDMVLMDYDLGIGTRGDEGLVEVRSALPYKDLVFYSANAADLTRLVAQKEVEGVFCSTRNDLPSEVFGLFEKQIKKIVDIDHARGIVMGSSSDIDGLVFDSLGAHFRNEDGKLSDTAKRIIADQLKDIRKTFEKLAEKVEAAGTVEDLYDLHLVYTSTHRHKLLRKLFEATKERDAICQAMSSYAANTVPKRNDLAHIQVKKEGFSRKLYNRKGDELTTESVRQLRLELLQHQEALEKLFEELSKP